MEEKKQQELSEQAQATEMENNPAPTEPQVECTAPTTPEPKPEKTWRRSLLIQQKWLSRLISLLLSLIITGPIFILIHKLLPYSDWAFHAERVALFLVLVSAFYYLFRKIRFFMLTIIVLLLGTLTVTSFVGKYSFKDLLMDYRVLMYNLADEDRSVQDLLTTKPFPKQKQILNAARITPKVKQFANKSANANFKKVQKKKTAYRMYIQCFSVFKEVNERWQYVNDPHKWDYIASADETLESFAGDCDDYAVLMASCLNAVGGTVRLVRTSDHIYPELKFTNHTDFDNICYLIRNDLFPKDIKKKNHINYHIDDKGNIWLNMDYTAKYPGGNFHSSDVVAILEIP